jgi:hypothetical protein
MSATRLLTERQIRNARRLPSGHRVVSVRDGAPIVRRPDGGLARMRPNGQLEPTIRIERVQSYLNLNG